MTTKINFIRSACVVFNCTPATVLSAFTGKSQHPETAQRIKAAAEIACFASGSEWCEFAASILASPVAYKLLFSLAMRDDTEIESALLAI